MNYNYIYDRVNNKMISIYSKEGKYILKNYLKHFLYGGGNANQVVPPQYIIKESEDTRKGIAYAIIKGPISKLDNWGDQMSKKTKLKFWARFSIKNHHYLIAANTEQLMINKVDDVKDKIKKGK